MTGIFEAEEKTPVTARSRPETAQAPQVKGAAWACAVPGPGIPAEARGRESSGQGVLSQLSPPFCTQLSPTRLPSASGSAPHLSALPPIPSAAVQSTPSPARGGVPTRVAQAMCHSLPGCHSQNHKHVAELNWSRTYTHAHTLAHAHTRFLAKSAKGKMSQDSPKSHQSCTHPAPPPPLSPMFRL